MPPCESALAAERSSDSYAAASVARRYEAVQAEAGADNYEALYDFPYSRKKAYARFWCDPC